MSKLVDRLDKLHQEYIAPRSPDYEWLHRITEAWPAISKRLRAAENFLNRYEEGLEASYVCTDREMSHVGEKIRLAREAFRAACEEGE